MFANDALAASPLAGISDGSGLVANGKATAKGSASIVDSALMVAAGLAIAIGTADLVDNKTLQGGGKATAKGSANLIHNPQLSANGKAKATGSADVTINTINIREFQFELYDPTTNQPITGAGSLTSIKFRRDVVGDYLDLYVGSWGLKTSGWTTLSTTMTETDSTHAPGLYTYTIDMGQIPDGDYLAIMEYVSGDASVVLHSKAPFTVKSGRNPDQFLTVGAMSTLEHNKLMSLPSSSDVATAVWNKTLP
jgi:hypothetical protein